MTKTETLFNILDNPKGKLICVDMDGTLCHGEYWHTGDEKEPEIILKTYGKKA